MIFLIAESRHIHQFTMNRIPLSKPLLAYVLKNYTILIFGIGGCFLSIPCQAQSPTFNYPSTCGLGITIPDEGCLNNNGIVQNINVNDLPANSRLGVDVFLEEVRLVIEHSFDADLNISLVSPNGQEVILSSNNGSGEENYGDPSDLSCGTFTSLTVLACQNIEDGLAPFIGAYMPQESFYHFNDQSDPNGNWQLKICDDVENDIGTLEYVELIFSSTNCLPPINVAVIELDSTTVSLDWEAGRECQTTIVEYGPLGFTPGLDSLAGSSGTVIFAACPPFNLDNLVEQTSYDIYIREHCNEGNFSANSCPINITTFCALVEDRIIEDFDNQLLCSTNCGDTCSISGVWSNIANDDFDWLIHADSTNTPKTGPQTDVSGNGNYIYLETSSNECRTDKVAYLLSNCILVEVQEATNCNMSFNYHAFGGDIGRLSFEVSTDGGANWTNLWYISGNQGNRWHKQYINLTAYNEQVVRFRFVGEGGPGGKGDIALDNIVFYGSIDLGPGDFIFYEDRDGDGFGDANKLIQSCSADLGSGFVTNDLDCNDNDAAIHPNAAEIPCNNIDENCNGNTDNEALSPPMISNMIACTNEEIILKATPIEPQADWIFWYKTPTGTDVAAPPDFLLEGVPYTPSPNNTDQVRIDSLYAEAQDFDNFCISNPRALVTISVMPNPRLNIAEVAEICRGQQFDLGTVNLIDEHNTNGSLTYHTASPTTELNQLSSSNIQPTDTTVYYIKSTTSSGCFDEIPVSINVSPGTNVNILGSDSYSLCFGTKDTLRLDLEDSSEDYFIRWSSNDTMITALPILSNTTIGATDVYSVTVTDASGCQSMDTVEVTTVVSIPSIAVTTTPVTSCNGQDASIHIEPNGGIPPFNYSLSGTQSSNSFGVEGAATFNNLRQGTYAITVTDASVEGCEIIFRNILVNGLDAQIQIDELEPVSCQGGNDGRICLEITGNEPSILWQNGATTACVDNLSAGIYGATITDNNCETILTIDLPEPDTILMSPNVLNPSCHESIDGQIDVTVNGGTPPYQFNWSNGASTEDIIGLSEGEYVLTITDVEGCTLEAKPILLTTPDPLSILVDTVHQISCAGAEDGRIFISITGGVAPYSYQWNDFIDTEDLNSLPEGEYEVVVTDANNCIERASFEIVNPSPIEVLSTIENASCPGLEDGNIFLDISGGTISEEGHQVNWLFDGESFNVEDLTNIPKGTYEVIVMDDNGCIFNTAYTVNAPERLDFNVEVNSPLCIGASNGSIDLTIGDAIESLIWNTQDTTEDLTNIPIGTYEVDIIAANGCLFDTMITVEANQVFEVDNSVVHSLCNGEADGSISLFVLNGGNPPYQFEWSNGATTQNINNLSSGIYNATLSNADDCIYVTQDFEINEPTPLEIIVDDVTLVNCFGEEDGSISVRLTGGTPPYEYILNDELLSSEAALREQLTDIPSGDYKISVRDANACTETISVSITQTAALTATSSLEGIEGCNNITETSADILLNVDGGNPPYTYLWSSGDSLSNLIDASAGIYDVSITDANNCSVVLTDIKVPNTVFPLKIDTAYATAVECFGMQNGSVNVVLTGGEAPYQFLWSAPFGQEGSTRDTFISTGSVLSASQDGYNITITDNKGCTVVSERLNITQPNQVLLSLPSDSIIAPPCEGSIFGRIMPVTFGGTPPYTYILMNPQTSEIIEPFDMQMIPPGTYNLLVEDALGCQPLNMVQFTMPEQATPLDADVTIHNILCHGASTGGIELKVSGGEPPFSFRWSNGATTQNLMNIPAGIYSVTIEDNNPCRRLLNSIEVEEPANGLALMDTTILLPTCFGDADGIIELEMSGGTMPYSYFWSHSNSIFSNKAEDLEAGQYEINVTDANGCTASPILVELENPEPISVDFNIVNATTDTSSNGSVTLIWTNGAEPLDLLWEDGSTDNSLLNVPMGTYEVTISDANNCILDTFVIIEADTIISNVNDYPKWLNKLTIAPNPVLDMLLLDMVFSKAVDVEVGVYNILGQEMMTWTGKKIVQRQIGLDMNTFAMGTYLLIIKGNGKILEVKKLVKVEE